MVISSFNPVISESKVWMENETFYVSKKENSSRIFWKKNIESIDKFIYIVLFLYAFFDLPAVKPNKISHTLSVSV